MRCLIAAWGALRERCAGEKRIEHLGVELQTGKTLPLLSFGDAVCAPERVHLGDAHEAGVVVLVPGEGQAESLDGVGNEAGGLVGVGAVKGLQDAFHVVTGEVGHERRERVVVVLVEQPLDAGARADIRAQVLAPGGAAFEHQRRVQRIGAVVDPVLETLASGALEGRLQALAVLEGLDPPAHVGEQPVEAAEQAIADHRIEGLAVVVDDPPEVAEIVLPALEQRLEHVALVELGVADQRDHAATLARRSPFTGLHIILDETREGGHGDAEADRSGGEVHVVGVLGP